jgi:hypothetical protein
MKEPLLFNTLDEAAIWLAEATGESWTAREVLNAVITRHDHRNGTELTTMLQAAPPLGTEFGLYGLGGLNEPLGDPFLLRRRLGWMLIPVHLNAAKLILACGEADFSFVCIDKDRDQDRGAVNNSVWVMPFGESVRVKLSMLGIGGNPLKRLALLLDAPMVVPHYVQFNIGAPPKSLPAPSAERTPKEVSRETRTEIGVLGSTPAAGMRPLLLSGKDIDVGQQSSAWLLNKPRRVKDPLASMIYNVLKTAHVAGEPCPRAREVCDRLEQNRPRDFVGIVGDEIKFLDGDGNVETKNMEAVRSRIKRFTMLKRAPEGR